MLTTVKIDPKALVQSNNPPRLWTEVQIEELQKEVAELKSQIRDLQDTIAQQNRRISSLECWRDGAKTFAFNSELDPDIPYLVGIDPAGGDSIKGGHNEIDDS